MKNTTTQGRARHYLVIGPWDHAGHAHAAGASSAA